jgi:L-ascorbate metabolism protein UlaG (beta-lactamase superfamily)
MTTRIRFFGVAGYELATPDGKHILIDPFLDGNPGSPVRSEDLERVNLVLVSHAAFDHLGDAEAIARRTGAPVVCGGEVKAYLQARGVPEGQVRATTWGIAVEVAGVRVQPVECHHWSQIRLPDGTFASGQPMGFVVYAEPGVRFYHYGDTALFSDLKLIGELYRPTVGCVGIANPLEILDRVSGPGRLLTAEMSPREGAMAASWLGLDTVLPCHYIDPDSPEVREFLRYLDGTEGSGPRPVVLRPGEHLDVEPSGDDASQ